MCEILIASAQPLPSYPNIWAICHVRNRPGIHVCQDNQIDNRVLVITIRFTSELGNDIVSSCVS